MLKKSISDTEIIPLVYLIVFLPFSYPIKETADLGKDCFVVPFHGLSGKGIDDAEPEEGEKFEPPGKISISLYKQNSISSH